MKSTGVIFACLLLAVAVKSYDLADDAAKYLLPGNVIPEHYEVTLHTNIENFIQGDELSFQFTGTSNITIIALPSDGLSEIIIHSSDDTTILSAVIEGVGNQELRNFTVTIGEYDSETNKQQLLVSPSLDRHRYRLIINYVGLNTGALEGFYRSSYRDENGVRRWLLTTDFESFEARWAFPCFDEPQYKATIRLISYVNQSLADIGYRTFFNSEIESEESSNGVHITTFKPTPRPISTYLVAFIIAPFLSSPEPAYFNSSYNGGNAIKPFTTIGQPKYFTPKRLDLLSQIAGPAALNAMTQLTRVGYGLDKVEQAGIPDFAAGAMENWGLVTYREELVFFDNRTGSASAKQSVVTVIAHELAHQWFGDLVTLHWWSDLWLNEGFATFFEFHVPDGYRGSELDTSDWELIGQFVTDYVEGAMWDDGWDDEFARPLTSEAYDRATIETFSDYISYDKGGSVLRMWLHALGPEIFYSGLNLYLEQQKESIGTPEILLASWDKAIAELPADDRPNLRQPVADSFRPWHIQAGYPLINVERDPQSQILTITQERFLMTTGDDSLRYNVPLTYSTDLQLNFNQTSPITSLLATEDSVQIPLETSGNAVPSWVIVNNQQTGYYRVNYDIENWDRILDALSDPVESELIHEYNRAQIIDDAYALGLVLWKDHLPITTFLRALSAIQHDRSLVVWRTANRVMRDFMNRALLSEDATTHHLLKNYFVSLVDPVLKEVGWELRNRDTHERRLLRQEVVELACFLGSPSCLERAHQLYQRRSYEPDVRKVVLCEGVKQGGEKEFSESFDLAMFGPTTIRKDYLHSLTCTTSNELLERLTKEISEGKFSKSDDETLLWGLFENHPQKTAELLKILESRGRTKERVWNKMRSRAQHLLHYHEPENSVRMGQKLADAQNWLSLNFA